MDGTHQGARTLLLIAACLLISTGPALGLGPGDHAPPFELPRLSDEGTVRAPDLFAENQITVLMIWDRGCPHCTDVALASPALADSVEPLGARVLGIVMGPDDPEVLAELFWDEGVTVPHLWDGDRKTAGPYGLGFLHLGVFVVDRAGVIRATFDDKIADPVTEIVPAVRAALAAPATTATPRATATMPAGWPVIKLDGRMRMLSTEGARDADTGLFGEHLTNGSILLYRWDIGLVWSLAPGIEVEPWFRLSNESDEVLTEGAERLSNRRGSITLRARRGPFSGAIGAFDARISPLLMQRWDEHDAPPIGGVSGCGVCGAGGSGLQQKSLEVLDPSYSFEGITGAYAHRYAVLRGWAAVDRWESEEEPVRFRRVLQGGSIDLGRSGLVDPDFGLPQPIGVRVGVVSVDDDQRTLPDYLRFVPGDRGEIGWVVLARAGSFYGLSADAERAGWTLKEWGQERKSKAWRAGVHGSWTVDSYSFWGRAHGIRVDRWFDPMYRSLTYEPDREGFRIAGGARRLLAPGATRERVGLSGFYRAMNPVGDGRDVVDYRVTSISLSTRPLDDLLAQLSYLRIAELPKNSEVEDAITAGFSLDLRWEGWSTLDPMLHVETVENDPRGLNKSTLWQAYLSVRVVR